MEIEWKEGDIVRLTNDAKEQLIKEAQETQSSCPFYLGYQWKIQRVRRRSKMVYAYKILDGKVTHEIWALRKIQIEPGEVVIDDRIKEEPSEARRIEYKPPPKPKSRLKEFLAFCARLFTKLA